MLSSIKTKVRELKVLASKDMRKHQKEFYFLCNRILREQDYRDVLLNVVPGGGKSEIPFIAQRQLVPHLADKICWITPRASLKYQATDRSKQIAIESEYDPNIHSGFVCCYNLLTNANYDRLLERFEEENFIVIYDEAHHVVEGGIWEERLKPIYEKSKLNIFMTGSIERGDKKRVFAFPYKLDESYKAYLDTSKINYIEYNQYDALKDKAILPLKPNLYEYTAKWEKGGATFNHNTTQDIYDSDSVFTALRTDFALNLLREGLEHFIENKDLHENSKCLVVAPNVDEANRYLEYIQTEYPNRNSKIATYKEVQAYKTVSEFRNGDIEILVTVAMAYEGLDVPAITHTICLTHIRSFPWLLQCLSRGNRVCKDFGRYERQLSYIFGPSDGLLDSAIDYMNRKSDNLLENKAEYDTSGEEHNLEVERVSPIESHLIELSSTCWKKPVYDWHKIKENYKKSNLNVADFCRANDIPVKLGHKILKGMNPRNLIDEEAIREKFIEFQKDNPYATSIDFYKANDFDFHSSTIKKAVRGLAKKRDYTEIKKHWKESGLTMREWTREYGEKFDMTYHQVRRHCGEYVKKAEQRKRKSCDV